MKGQGFGPSGGASRIKLCCVPPGRSSAQAFFVFTGGGVCDLSDEPKEYLRWRLSHLIDLLQ